MSVKEGTKVKLKSFLGKPVSLRKVEERENYWKLIGETGTVIQGAQIEHGRVLVLFDKNLDKFNIENHNPVKNSLWIKKSDLELDNQSKHKIGA